MTLDTRISPVVYWVKTLTLIYDPMQVDKSLEVRGEWTRWSRYELVNSTVVPCKDAELVKYDPWQAFRSNVGKYRTVTQPFNSLLELGRHLENEEKRDVRPSKINQQSALIPVLGPQNGADKLILDWCNEHGLLGLLPVLSTSIRLSEHASHIRSGGEWVTDNIEEEIRHSTTLSRRKVERGEQDSLTPSVDRSADSKITWLSWLFAEYEVTPLSDKGAFFGAWNPTHTLTPWRPGSEMFWKVYGEPVHDFGEWCIVFTHCVNLLSLQSAERADKAGFITVAHRVLTRLAESAAPVFEFHPTRRIVLDEVRTPAGLLASYALMFLWDLTDGRRGLRCARCDRYLVSDDPRAAYCSQRCRNTAQNRRYRAQKKTEG